MPGGSKAGKSKLAPKKTVIKKVARKSVLKGPSVVKAAGGGKSTKSTVGATKKKSAPGKLCKLEDLLKDKVIKCGLRVLRVERKGQTFYGDLSADGTIDYSTANKPVMKKSFPTPSAFSNFCCRRADSGFKYGNGFTYTHYSGDNGKTWKQLDYYRKQ